MNMIFKELPIEGVFEIDFKVVQDERGAFVKTFHSPSFHNSGCSFTIKETYFSVSKKNVIRGMHFQVPPYGHSKLVFVTEGMILDVILDLRKNSKTFGSFHSLEISALSNGVLIPSGFAHGFLTLSDTATVVYQVSEVYNAASDSGILWDSFGFNWGLSNPILSIRDNSFLAFNQFKSPF